MNRAADDHSQASSGIRQVLVRRLPAGDVVRCGTVHAVAPRHHQRVVIQTATGLWLAECLAHAGPQGAGELSGELLRIATEQDLTLGEQAAAAADALRIRAQERIAETQLPLLIVAAEIDLDQQWANLRFLGNSHERLGPLAVQLADEHGLQRVQWVAIENPKHPDATESSEQLAEHAFWARFSEITAAPSDGAANRDAVSALGQSLGKEFRVAAGNRGLYQQKRRGASPANRRLPSGRSWMLRVRTAAGGIAATQLLRLLEIAAELADGTLRLTLRQAIQLHGVAADASDEVMRRLGERLLSTAGSCGNSVRNLTCCPLPIDADPVKRLGQREVRELAGRLAADLLPRGPAFEYRFSEDRGAYASEPGTNASEHADEAFAGQRAATAPCLPLPHKFKVGVASDRHDCADVLTNDLALVVRTDGLTLSQRPERVDLYVGGSTAYRVDDPQSFPQLARWLGTIALSDALPAAEMLIQMFARRDSSGPRHLSRWKYVVQRTGLETLVDQFHQQAGGRIELQRTAAAPLQSAGHQHAARGECQDGGHWLRLLPLGGRLTQDHLPALRHLCDLRATVRVGTQHDLVASFAAHRIDESLFRPWLASQAGASTGRACPALPTCPLAVAAAETQLEIWATAAQQVALQHGLPPLPLALSGCANGCSRPLNSPLGLIAETPSQRAVFLGGSCLRLGLRIGQIETPQQFAKLLGEWLSRFVAEKSENEDFDDWFWRTQGK